MRRVSPDFIEQVRLANDIVDIIGEDTFLKRTGTRYMGLCPFPAHNENTPSFSVSADQQLYHCFGCGQSGNIFTYMQVRRGMHFMEAVQSLAGRAGLTFPDTQRVDDKKYLERRELLDINLSACEFYERNLQNLPASHPVRQYLKQRDLSKEIVQKFRLGYAKADWEGVFSYLKQTSCNLNPAEKLGLIKKKKDNLYYDFFRDRLMFPVFAKNGKDVLGFGGRTLDENQPKYINSMDSFIFHKGRTFYGWQYTASAIRDTGKALVVEGYTDYLSLYQRGIHNVVATLGTALTEDHARWLARYAEQVVLSFDGDQAGKKAAERSLNVLLFCGLIPKVLRLQEGMDPDSFIRAHGKQALQDKAKAAQDLFLYLFSKELKQYPAGVDRLPLIKKIAGILVQTEKAVLREYYTSRFLDSFGFDRKVAQKALERELKKGKLKKARGSHSVVSFRDANSTRSEKEQKASEKISDEDQGEEKISLGSAPKSELYLLILALQSPEYYKKIKKSGVIEQLNHNGIIRMFKVISEYSAQELECFEALTQILSVFLYDPRELQKSQYPSLNYLSTEKVDFFIQDCIDKVEEEKKHLNLKNITANMRLDRENANKYLMQIAEWTKKSKNPENEI